MYWESCGTFINDAYNTTDIQMNLSIRYLYFLFIESKYNTDIKRKGSVSNDENTAKTDAAIAGLFRRLIKNKKDRRTKNIEALFESSVTLIYKK